MNCLQLVGVDFDSADDLRLLTFGKFDTVLTKDNHMAALKNELIDAEMLARFAELKPEEVEDFRHSVAPGFVPEPWWDFNGYRIADWKIWQEMQDLLRNTWDAGFPTDYTLSIL